jgi:hypothetical protein
MGALKALAHSKIHCVNSSARGEIAYARYVYASTPKGDDTIRRPVASFWAHRSHVLRREAEDEFRQMCLEFPEFGYDVLSKFYTNCISHYCSVVHMTISSYPRREVQERRRSKTYLHYPFKFPKATASEPGIGDLCGNLCLDTVYFFFFVLLV